MLQFIANHSAVITWAGITFVSLVAANLPEHRADFEWYTFLRGMLLGASSSLPGKRPNPTMPNAGKE